MEGEKEGSRLEEGELLGNWLGSLDGRLLGAEVDGAMDGMEDGGLLGDGVGLPDGGVEGAPLGPGVRSSLIENNETSTREELE